MNLWNARPISKNIQNVHDSGRDLDIYRPFYLIYAMYNDCYVVLANLVKQEHSMRETTQLEKRSLVVWKYQRHLISSQDDHPNVL